MAKIYDFELKGVKDINEGGLIANLYYNNKKIGSYLDNNDDTLPVLTYDKKITDEMVNDIMFEIKEYYKANPKEMISNTDEYIIVEFIEELYRLRELENIFKKTNKKEKNILLELKFSKREEYISKYQKEDICITTSLWNKEFKEKLIKKYNPVECNIYSSLDEFIINK